MEHFRHAFSHRFYTMPARLTIAKEQPRPDKQQGEIDARVDENIRASAEHHQNQGAPGDGQDPVGRLLPVF